MYLVLSDDTDWSAQWAVTQLAQQGLSDVRWITSRMLAYSSRWSHHVDHERCEVSCWLPDGTRLHSDQVSGVLNRLSHAPLDSAAMAVPGDRDYAMQELGAFYLSWLHGLATRTVNRPTPQGLCGRWMHASEWAMLAHASGLKTPVYRQSAADSPERGYAPLAAGELPRRQVIVLGEQCFGAIAPDDIQAGCVKLARAAEVDLLGIDFAVSDDGIWTFSSATALPHLPDGGAPLISALADHLQQARLS